MEGCLPGQSSNGSGGRDLQLFAGASSTSEVSLGVICFLCLFFTVPQAVHNAHNGLMSAMMVRTELHFAPASLHVRRAANGKEHRYS